ncbi:MAG: hypothetical protein ACJ77A_00620 [Actinomycetota bacterium]
MRRLLVVLAVVGVFGWTGTALADPNLTNVPPHRHYILSPTGQFVQVGPRVCDDPSLQAAFNQFHNNLHVVTSSGIGPAAPGLHNLKGAEIFAGPC